MKTKQRSDDDRCLQLNRTRKTSLLTACLAAFLTAITSTTALAQAVCLPAPRLLTTMRMGGQGGTSVERLIAQFFVSSEYRRRFGWP